MDLSIIIVNYRGWAKLRNCLDRIKEFYGKDFSCEVIISDNDSSDGELQSFREAFPDFTFLENPVNGGYAYGCNRGAAKASGKYLLFLNPDTEAGRDAIGYLLGRAGETEGDFVMSCRQTGNDGRESRAWGVFPSPGQLTGTGRLISGLFKGRMKTSEDKSGGQFINPDWLSGSVIMIKNDFFHRLGGFDEDFWMYYEDVDLCRRAKDAGAGIFFFLKPEIKHFHGGSSRINIKTAALTKTEVIISRHVYVSKHVGGTVKFLSQTFLVIAELLNGLLLSLIGILLFFNKSAAARLLMYINLISFYLYACRNGSWISRRSVNAL